MRRQLDSAQAVVKEILGFYDDLATKFEKFAGLNMNKAKLSSYHEVVFPTPQKKDQPVCAGV